MMRAMYSVIAALFVGAGVVAVANHQNVEAAVLVVGGNIMGLLVCILRKLEDR